MAPPQSLLALSLCLIQFIGVAKAHADDPGAAPYKARYKVINVHRHCPIPSEAAVRAELEVDDQVGVSAVVILDGSSAPGNLEAWNKLKAQFPGRLIVFWKLDFAHVANPTFFEDILKELQHAADLGAQGVKVWKDLGMYVRDGSGALLKVDDARLDAFWERCADLGLPVLLHTADPKEYWYPLTYNSVHYGLRKDSDQLYNKPEMPSWEELMRQRDAVLQKHPRTIFIGAHFGSMSFELQKLGEALDRYPNFFVDTSARLRIVGRLNPPAVRDFFTKYQDRILFGTDGLILLKGRTPSTSANISVYPNAGPPYIWIDPSDVASINAWKNRDVTEYSLYFQYFETSRYDLTDPTRSGGPWQKLTGAELPPEVLEKIYHANAERLIPGLKK
jgi:predicted TIM-barrel fold metal-dependent hydrolase